MKDFISNVIDLFDELPEVELTESTQFKELPGWDSLVALSLIVMISNEYGKSIDGGTIRSLSTIGELYRHVKSGY